MKNSVVVINISVSHSALLELDWIETDVFRSLHIAVNSPVLAWCHKILSLVSSLNFA